MSNAKASNRTASLHGQVVNEIIFQNVGCSLQERILRMACNAAGEVDFAILVPPPNYFWTGAQDDEVLHRVSEWREWAMAVWGTYRNAFDSHPIERSTSTLTLRFRTIWAPPYGWTTALFNEFKLPFDHNWIIQRDGRGRCGKFTSEERDRWTEVEADGRHA